MVQQALLDCFYGLLTVTIRTVTVEYQTPTILTVSDHTGLAESRLLDYYG